MYAEALHNYLHFTCDDYRKPGGTAIHTYPAIKFADDRDALIAGLLDGRLATTATDEYTVHKAYKLSGSTIETVCGGHNGIETRMPVAFTKFVAERRMPLTRFVDITSANAARILGLYPQKGAIQPGSDADLVLIDPAVRKTIALADLHADADYSIWEGFACQGYPVMTILRGKVIVEQGAGGQPRQTAAGWSAGSRATFWAARRCEPASLTLHRARPAPGPPIPDMCA